MTIPDTRPAPSAAFRSWFAGQAANNRQDVRRVPLSELAGWAFEPGTGNLAHRSGRFFTVEGLRVCTDHGGNRQWVQPIIVQPERGLLGILVKRFDGVPHYLLQAKVEPGNVNGLQLSPTVQATRSNYDRVHGGRPTRYLEFFTGARRGQVLADVLQSEQGSWFLHKRNRNMVVETTSDVAVGEDFFWFTLRQIRDLLLRDNLINMDARSVLACLPPALGMPEHGDGEFREAVRASLAGEPAESATRELLSWLTDIRARTALLQDRVPLSSADTDGWRCDGDRVFRPDGRYFEVIGVDVRAANREVGAWQQPLLAPSGVGLIGLAAKRVHGSVQVLVQARPEAGSLAVAELAPTVQCRPANYADEDQPKPMFLGEFEALGPARIRYDTVQSEEGGRFYHAQNRYVVAEVDEDFPAATSAYHRWVTLRQLTDLLVHGNYLNVELRTLLACVQSL